MMTEEENININSRVMGSKGVHIREKEYVKENGTNKMSDEEIDQEIVELKERISMMST